MVCLSNVLQALAIASLASAVATATNSSAPIAGAIEDQIAQLSPAFHDQQVHPITHESASQAFTWSVSAMGSPHGAAAAANVALYGAPVCVAYNVVGTARQVVTTIQELRDALSGNATATNALREFRFALTAPSAASSARVVLQALAARGLVPPPSATDPQWPASIAGGGSLFLASEAAASAHVAATPGTATFIPLAAGSGLPCAHFRTTDALGQLPRRPKLGSATTPLLDVAPAVGHVATDASSTAYPLIGPLALSVAANATCASWTAAFRAASTAVASTLSTAMLQTWGFAPLAATDGLAAVRTLAETPQAAACAQVPVLKIGGSSAIADPTAAWATAFAAESGVLANYVADGSGAGHRGVQSGARLLGGAESMMTDEERATFPTVRQLPLLGFAVAVVFNLPGIDELILPRCLLNRIFQGRITSWAHPDIRAANPATPIPDIPIRVMARAGRSGTTGLLLDGIKSTAETCPGGIDNATTGSVWPYSAFALHSGTSALFAAVQALEGAIGYGAAGSAQTAGLPIAGVIDERSQAVVYPATASVVQALDGATMDPVTGAVTPRLAPSTYPFVGVAYLLIDSDRRGNCSEYRMAVDWLLFGVTTPRGQAIAEAAFFTTISGAKRAVFTEAIAQLRCDGVMLFPPPPPGPTDLTAVIIVGSLVGFLALVLAALGGRALHQEMRRRAALARCPADASRPFSALFIGVMNEADLRDHADDDDVNDALAKLEKIIRSAGVEFDCHEARRVDAATVLVVAKRPEDALRLASHLMTTKRPHVTCVGGGGGGKFGDSCGLSRVSNSDGSPMNRSRTSALRRAGQSQSDVPSSAASGHRSNAAVTRECSLELNIGLAFGFGQISHNAELNTFAYMGDVVDDAAIVADAAGAGETLVTAKLVEALEDEAAGPDGSDVIGRYGKLSLFIGDARPDSGESSPLDDASVFTPHGMERRTKASFNARSTTGNQRGGGGHIASALARADAGLSLGRSALIAIHLPYLVQLEGADRATASQLAKRAHHAVETIGTVVASMKGHVHGCVGTFVMVSVNATASKTRVSQPIHRAAGIALALVDALAESVPADDGDSEMVSVGIAAGPALTGDAAETAVMFTRTTLDHAIMASRAARTLKTQIVLAAAGESEIGDRFFEPIVDIAMPPAGLRSGAALETAALRMRAVVGERPESCDEWMYELERGDNGSADTRWSEFLRGEGRPAAAADTKAAAKADTNDTGDMGSPLCEPVPPDDRQTELLQHAAAVERERLQCAREEYVARPAAYARARALIYIGAGCLLEDVHNLPTAPRLAA